MLLLWCPQVVRFDADDAVRRLLAPLSWRFRLTIPSLVAAVLVVIRIVGWAFGSAAPPAVPGEAPGESPGEFPGGGFIGEFGVVFVVLVGFACVGGALMPDSGITADFRDEWDR
jgi:hypothetical protein